MKCFLPPSMFLIHLGTSIHFDYYIARFEERKNMRLVPKNQEEFEIDVDISPMFACSAGTSRPSRCEKHYHLVRDTGDARYKKTAEDLSYRIDPLAYVNNAT